MAARSRSAGLALVIGTEYNDRDLKNLQRDLDKLKSKSRQAEGPFKKLGNTLKSNAGPALAAAGAAAGYMAIQMGVEAVKAAAEEEKQLANLAITLKNLGVAFDMKELDAFIQSMQFATGVSDDELRASFTQLVRVTRDVASAQDLLKLALDVSAGSGKSLSTVTGALSKAQAGNFSALKRLIPSIDATAIAHKDLSAVVASLEGQFSGSAASAAQTYSGQLAILSQVAQETQQAFGAGFLAGFFNTTDVTKATAEELKNMQQTMEDTGRSIGQLAGMLAELGQAWSNTVGVLYDNDLMPLQVLGKIIGVYMGDSIDLTTTAATALDRYSESWKNSATVVTNNPIVGVVQAVDPYGQALGIQPDRFKKVIQGIIDAAQSAREAADQANTDAAAAAAETARKLAERTKKRTDAIISDLMDGIAKAKAARDEFASIRRDYVQAARDDAAITTFNPQGPVTSRGIEANIRQRLGLIKKFAAAVKSLQGKLNGAALADIIAQGPVAGLPYAQALANDAATVGRINALQSQLATPAGTIGRIGAELATGTTAAKLAAAETFTNKYVVGKDAINITVNGELTAGQRRQLKQAVREALSGIGREGKNGKATNIK